MWELDHKEGWAPKYWCFWTVVLEKTLESLWTARRSNQSILKDCLNIYWKDWCWSSNSNTLATWWEELTHWKRPWFWERLKVGGEGDDRGCEMVGWHHWLNEHEFEQALGDGEGQGGLACCSSWSRKESDTTEQLNRTELSVKRGFTGGDSGKEPAC